MTILSPVRDSTPRFFVHGKEVAINLFSFQLVGSQNLGSVAYRDVGAADWSEIPVLDSSDAWSLEAQKQMGGFAGFVKHLMGRIQAALDKIFGLVVDAPVPVLDPQTFSEVIAFVEKHLRVVESGAGAKVVEA